MFDKILNFYTKYFAFWVVLVSALAFVCPAPFIAAKGSMNIFFALTMFGIGAILRPDDFKEIFLRPYIVLIGVVSQFTIMPLGAFAISKLLNLAPELALGLILTGSAPGAMASNVMSYVAGADVAYSVSLTTVSTLLTPFMTPGLTYLLARSILEVDFWAMFFSVLKMVILPLFAGFFVRYLLKTKIDKIVKIFPAISVTFIIFICALVIALNKSYLLNVTFIIFLTTVLLNMNGMFLGYGVGKAFKLSIKQRRTLSIEIGMQNAGLGTVLALKHFNERVAVPAAIFVFVCIITASVAAEIWRKK